MFTRNLLKLPFSKAVPIVDLQPFLTNRNSEQQCQVVMNALKDYGCLIIKDPRVKPKENEHFLDMMEKFFDSRSKDYYQGTIRDIFPETSYQVGATPEFKELAKGHSEIKNSYKGEHKPTTKREPDYDAKWRFFWRTGELTEEEKTKNVRHEPEGFPEWKSTMDSWGAHMLNGCFTVAEMFAVGAGMTRDTFTKLMERGPHMLGPTGSDLVKHKKNTVFASFHYDLNFLTIHGKSRYPGLFVWLKTGQKINVNVPQDHLLLQVGKQFQILTGGYVTCGFHEVVYTQETRLAKQRAVREGKIPWRVSSTLFSVTREDVILEPIGRFREKENASKYKPIVTKEYIEQELKDIKLGA